VSAGRDHAHGRRHEAGPQQGAALGLGQHGLDRGFTPGQITGVGTLEVLAAIGLTVPAALGIVPALTPLAATGVVELMSAAAATHRRRSEQQMVLVNLLIAGLALFVAIEGFGPHWL
jgi:hypothetical protein